jgi:hypothetical protein
MSDYKKTNVVLRWTDSTSTVGVDFRVETATIDDNTVKLEVWASGGSERFQPISPAYFQQPLGAASLRARSLADANPRVLRRPSFCSSRSSAQKCMNVEQAFHDIAAAVVHRLAQKRKAEMCEAGSSSTDSPLAADGQRPAEIGCARSRKSAIFTVDLANGRLDCQTVAGVSSS